MIGLRKKKENIILNLLMCITYEERLILRKMICTWQMKIEAICLELVKISKDIRQNKIIAVFTHEWCIEESMFEKIENMCKFAEFYNYSFTFIDKNSKIEEAQNEYFRGIRVI